MATQNQDEQLYWAARNGNLEEVKQLLSKGANVNATFYGGWVKTLFKVCLILNTSFK